MDYIDSWRKVPRRPVHMVAEEEVGVEEKTKENGSEGIGSGDVRRVLQRLYYSRARVLTQTVQSFAEGFRDGMTEVHRQQPQKRRERS